MRIVLVLALCLAACGGSGAPPEEEVTASWTSGDDEPLEAPDEAE